LKKRGLFFLAILVSLLFTLPGCGGGANDSAGDTVFITVANTTTQSVTSDIADPTITVHNFTVTSTAYSGVTNPSPVRILQFDVTYTPLTYDGVNMSPPLSVTYSQVATPAILNAGDSSVIEVGVVDTVAKAYLNGTSTEAENIRTLLGTLAGLPLKYTAHITVRAVEINTNRPLSATATCEVYLIDSTPVPVP